MSLVPGTRLGPYEIISAIGAGGMGEVYKARDTTLDRDVAIKILPAMFVADPERVARFQREARTLASLNHPNIAHIHGLDESGGVSALVMELVEGEDLSHRIARGAIPLEEALPIAKQIAEALEAAHEQGIVHRDLKPANIKVRPDGTVKVLDFGLAKAMEPTGAMSASVSTSPTITTPAMTQAGMILGTAAYMSPEQAKGRTADKRSDVWAFGCVFYEMLTGKRAFVGEDLTDTIAAVVRGEPSWSDLPANVSEQIRLMIRRCLEKDRRRRVGDFSTARFLMSESIPSADILELRASRPEPKAHIRRGVWAVAGLLGGAAIAVVGGGVAMRLAPSRPAQPVRFAIVPPPGLPVAVQGQDRDIAISPDGTRIIYRAGGTSPQLVVRAIDQLDATPIAGTANARAPFISPDGHWLGFFVTTGSNVEIMKVPIAGGTATTLCRANGAPRGASWGDNDMIVFATADPATGLMSVPAGGGDLKVLTKPNPGEGDHVRPSVLPGGRAVLFTLLAGPVSTIATQGQNLTAQIAVLDLMSGERRMLIQGGGQPEYVASGHLVYAAAGILRAVRFDLARLQVLGDPVPIMEEVNGGVSLAANFAVSLGGTLVHVRGGNVVGPSAPRTLVWVSRQGREEPISAPARAYVSPRISPDGTRVALDVRDQNNDIWVWEFARRTLTPLTFDPTPDVLPVWTPDGRRIVFSSGRNGQSNLFWQAADGTGPTDRLATSPNQQIPTSFSSDGKRLVFQELMSGGDSDIGLLTLADTIKTEALIHSSANEMNADLSPDGRWLAYQSNESGQNQVYVRPFPNVDGGRWQVSIGEGTRPLWARNGQELFFLDGKTLLNSVPVHTTGATFSAGNPTKVLNTAYWTGLAGRPYDAAPNGQQFLMIKDGGSGDQAATAGSLIVVVNWVEDLKRLVPTK